MAYGCSGVVFGMFELEKGILTNFHTQKKTNNRGKHALYNIWGICGVEDVIVEPDFLKKASSKFGTTVSVFSSISIW